MCGNEYMMYEFVLCMMCEHRCMHLCWVNVICVHAYMYEWVQVYVWCMCLCWIWLVCLCACPSVFDADKSLLSLVCEGQGMTLVVGPCLLASLRQGFFRCSMMCILGWLAPELLERQPPVSRSLSCHVIRVLSTWSHLPTTALTSHGWILQSLKVWKLLVSYYEEIVREFISSV